MVVAFAPRRAAVRFSLVTVITAVVMLRPIASEDAPACPVLVKLVKEDGQEGNSEAISHARSIPPKAEFVKLDIANLFNSLDSPPANPRDHGEGLLFSANHVNHVEELNDVSDLVAVQDGRSGTKGQLEQLRPRKEWPVHGNDMLDPTFLMMGIGRR